jgi:hypothetical protein
MIKFELDINDYNLIEDLSILQYKNDSQSDDIKKLITYFNSEYTWDKMFNFNDVTNRIKNNHLLFILYYGNKPIGYVFFEPITNSEFYLYNLYVTNKVYRPSYAPQWFVNRCITLLPKPFLKVSCKCEDWHVSAQNVFISNGFIKI